MSTDQSHTKYDQLAAGFALSALEPEDELAFRAHLPGCARCEQALLEHSTTMGHLAYAASSEEPPASVLEGIRAGVRASRTDALRSVEAPASLDAARERRTVRLSTALVGVAASLIAALAIVFASGGLGSKQPASSDVAFERILQQLVVPGARSVSLAGKGRAVAVLNGGKVSLDVAGMSVNDKANSVYVLWGKSRYGGVRAVGVFDVTSTKALAITNLGTVTPGTLSLLMVTREQGRQAPAVTTQQPILSGQV
jgi:hypothetical protein